MIRYFIERGGFVIADGHCRAEDLPTVDRLGGELVFESTLPKAGIDKRAAALTRRQQLLESSDWTQLPDVPTSTKDSWAAYRQALRDITDQVGFPQSINWPVQPDRQS